MRTEIQALQSGPINRLFFAINHYVSTGEHLGQGVALEGDDPGTLLLQIPYDPDNPTHAEDFERFRARLEEITQEEGLRGELREMGWAGKIRVAVVLVRKEELTPLADGLMEKPSDLGWGSGKAAIDQARRRGLRLEWDR